MRKFLFAFLALLGVSIAHAAAPTVTLTASPTSGASPLDTTLTWSSTGATTCTASGGWTGTKALSGTQVVTGLSANTTFSLTCAAPDGTATLSWAMPTQYTSGTAIATSGPDALAGAKAYWGTSASTLTSSKDVPGATATTTTVSGLTAGTWYFAVTAYTTNAESAKTGTVSKQIVVSSTATASVTVTPVPNPPTLLTVTAYIWDVKNGLPYRLVAYAPVGTPCGDFVARYAKKNYYEVDRANVTGYLRTPRSDVLVSRCEPTT